jgi:hypothetical protein
MKFVTATFHERRYGQHHLEPEGKYPDQCAEFTRPIRILVHPQIAQEQKEISRVA